MGWEADGAVPYGFAAYGDAHPCCLTREVVASKKQGWLPIPLLGPGGRWEDWRKMSCELPWLMLRTRAGGATRRRRGAPGPAAAPPSIHLSKAVPPSRTLRLLIFARRETTRTHTHTQPHQANKSRPPALHYHPLQGHTSNEVPSSRLAALSSPRHHRRRPLIHHSSAETGSVALHPSAPLSFCFRSTLARARQSHASFMRPLLVNTSRPPPYYPLLHSFEKSRPPREPIVATDQPSPRHRRPRR